MSKIRWSRIHQVAAVIWALLLIPTILWWQDSVFWVATMSLYANVVGHWSAYQASKADEHQTQG